MSFNPFNIDLPVTEIIPSVRSHLSQHNTLLVSAPPGAGKSTLLPLALLNEEWLAGKKIIMLEPRRIAARSIAHRMAILLEEEIGESVGYRIRFENRIGKNTRLEVVTEGILTRMLQNDNALEKVGLVIFDEFHERSLHADVALALCRDAQQVLRPDLRILVMSATLDLVLLKEKLRCEVLESAGRQFPVEIIHGNDADERLLPELCARVISQALREQQGDVLVFLPGEAEIRKTAELLQNNPGEAIIYPLYGQLPHAEQQRAIFPDRNGRRKVVLATSIAETSLTIEGIRIVVDSGFARTPKFDVRSGLTKLETVRVSKDSADQRAGRAGRLSAGICYRLWTKATHERLAAHRTPEIQESDLADLVLDLAQWGIFDVEQLTWLTRPPSAAIFQARDILEQIGALEEGKITKHGKELHRLACHPRLAHMLLMARDEKEKQLATDLAAIIEERDPLPKDSGIDINLRVEALRRARANNSAGKFSRIEKVAASYRQMLKVEADNGIYDPHDSGFLLAQAYPERIASARPGNNAQFHLANGKIAAAGHRDDLAHEAWLAVAHADMREGLGKIFLAAPLNPKDLLPLVKEKEVILWDSRKGGLQASRDLRIGNLVLQSKPISNPVPAGVKKALLHAIKTEGAALFEMDESFENLLNRLSSLRSWNPEESWPQYDFENVFEDPIWLEPYLEGIKKSEQLRAIDLSEALRSALEWDKQQELEKLAPAKTEVPSGSKIRLKYFANGKAPELHVRLQEVFGLADTPTVNAGKIKVTMHLLSPGYKPVQVTSDLKSFWNNLYFEIKKELQRRYPKHAWPDDPWNAKAVAKGRSEKR